jgi:spore germination cell wall hydrolase CwlJ-like protein
MILETAILCLALNIYHEARGELIPGQYAVANVTMNRAGSKERVCSTVTEPKQFSWTNKLVTRQGGQHVLKREGYPKDEVAWDRAQRIAKVVLKRPDLDFTNGATFYHANYVAPTWRLSVERTKRMGSHIFYKAR